MENSKFKVAAGITSALLIGSLAVTMQAQAVSISNGSLFVDINATTGAIDTLIYGSTDWYNPGVPVSDWGIQSSTNTSSFAVNTTTGSAGIPVSSVTNTFGTVHVTAAYNSDSGNTINIDRDYSLISGFDALLVSTTLSVGSFSNSGNIRLFDTFDPDMTVDLGGSFFTFMDVTTIGGFNVAEAWITSPTNLAVVMGTADVLASGNPFSISSGSDLNNLFSTPGDANGAFVDEGIHLGFEANLDAPTTSVTFSYIQAYGTTLANAEAEFSGAAGIIPVPDPVPVPAAIWLFGSGLIGLIGIARRKV